MGSGADAGGEGWFLDFDGLEGELRAANLICWPAHIVDDPAQTDALRLDILSNEDNFDATSRKRSRENACAKVGTKACREKMRRDRLNDRLMELSSILYPGRPLKADKVAVLSDATRHLDQLRTEAQKLKESNDALLDKIKSLKADKLELRDEKVRLKAEIDRVEQLLKTLSIPSFIAHPVAAPFHHSSYAAEGKNVPHPAFSPASMWRWIPQTALDTSQDHALRPPVA